jgi:hypothetical protein
MASKTAVKKKAVLTKPAQTKSLASNSKPIPTQRPVLIRRKKGPLSGVWSFIMWLVGLLVSLAVGFGMTDGTLKIPLLPQVLTVTAGWIVVVLAILGVLLKLIDLASR